jgi:tetratricopeptide (TPR) repeat protein
LLEGVFLRENPEGSRSLDPQKAAKDATVLQKALKGDPYNSRYVFYLAQSYRGMSEWRKALEAYQRRTTMGGFDQEVYCAYYYAAVCSAEARLDVYTVMMAYLRAYQYRPRRAEPLCELARCCRERELWSLAYLFAKQAASIPHPGADERLFVYETVYSWRALDEWAVAASWTGRWLETKQVCERLLAGPALPDCERGRVQRNLELARATLRVPTITAEAA